VLTPPNQKSENSFSDAIVGFFTQKRWLKILSLVFSLLLFLIVRTQQVREFSKTARVSIHSAANMIVVGNSERFVDVSVKLPESLFSRQPSDEELVGEVDLSQEKPGKLRLRLSRDNFPLLDKRYTLTIHEAWFEVELDLLVQKSVSLRALLEGQPREGLEVERVIVNPENVILSGAKKELAKMDFLNTNPINIDGIDKNFSSLARIAPSEGSSIKVDADKANIQVIVGPRKEQRVFRFVRAESTDPRIVVLNPESVEVVVQGESSHLQSLSPKDIRVFVDSENFEKGRYNRKVRLKIPSNTSLVRVVPDSVEVTVP
jgi:YbbR domain-containing protein